MPSPWSTTPSWPLSKGGDPVALSGMRLLPLLLVIAGCQSAPGPQAAPDDPRLPLGEALGATPLGPGEPGVVLRGVRERAGRSTPIELAFWSGGAFRLRLGEGSAPPERGFDGSVAWVADGRGATRRQQLGSREHLVSEGWARTQQWLTSSLDGSAWSTRAADPDAGGVQLLQRADGTGAVVTVDGTTGRPVRFELRRSGRLKTIALGDWTLQDGRWLPMTVTESIDGTLSLVDRFEVRERSASRGVRPPRSAPRDVTFQASGAPLGRGGVRFDRGGRAFVKTTINGRREAWMLLDSGFGSHAITRSLADELDLVDSAPVRLRGVGDSAAAGRRRGRVLEVGVATLADPSFVELDTDFLSERAGFTVDGVLGAPLFDRCIVIIDDLRGLVELHDPARFQGADLRWQPLALDGTAPCVRGQIRASGEDTPELWFRLDTGSDDTVTVSRWVVRAHGLAGDRTGLAPRTLQGPFGEVRGWRKTASVVVLAGSNMGRQTVTLMRDDVPGPLSDRWIGGNVGMRLLRGRRTVLDLSAGRVAIVAEDRGGED